MDRCGEQFSSVLAGRERPLGAVMTGEAQCSFQVWAPRAKKVDLHITFPNERIVPMQSAERGYFHADVSDVDPGTLYYYRLDDGRERPDPASRFQPQGVHGPSEVVENDFPWTDGDWRGLALEKYVLYELHVGTFTPAGTFDAIIPRIAALKELGITAIELMPVAQFPGNRNWGYDGVYPYAVQESYGGPAALKRLVNACHEQGMAIVLDVVYNHLGPEGNYSSEFGEYFTDLYKTPWGQSLNFDAAASDEVRRYFIENALQWITDFHFDALRLDAIHAIVDPSATPFLQELADHVHARAEQLHQLVYLFPESNRNDAREVTSPSEGGLGLDSVWNDDFHHALHVLLTGEQTGYYEDFHGVNDLAQAFRAGFVYSGQYSKYRGRRHGNSSQKIPGQSLIVFAQNHDQVGNRLLGDRLAQTASFEQLKLAAGVVLLAPYIPLIFMGEEYGDTAPFLYFVSHGDPALVEAVRKGRAEEFARFGWGAEIPDPQSEETFGRSKLNWELRKEGRHGVLWNFYRELLRLRREIPALARLDKKSTEVVAYPNQKTLFLRRWNGASRVFAVFNFDTRPVELSLPIPAGQWQELLESAEKRWQGSGSEVPESIDSRGGVSLSIAASAFCLFVESGKNQESEEG
ncbi:MAG: malto-oligosyltrehalose trehalohydrolase [Candidatus Acidiferrales bacterium]